MNATRDRLLECFVTVFPSSAPAELTEADIDNLAAWDSSNHILLMQVIEEQFGSPVDDNRMAELTSFVAIEQYLSGQGNAH